MTSSQQFTKFELGMPLDDVIANVIAALKADAVRLGLAGSEC